MHPIELQIYKYLQDPQNTISEELLNKFGEETKSALKKHLLEEAPSRSFTLRMSNIGRPLCQLQMEKQYGSTFKSNMTFLFGDIVEDIVLFLIHASGIKVISEQERVSLNIGGIDLKGTLDVILEINGRKELYDIKSASDFSFKQKRGKSFIDFLKSDSFGYCEQLFAYSEAKKVHPGGFIFVSKSTGEIFVLGVPEEHEHLKVQALKNIERTITGIDKPFERQFEAVEETFNKKPTGNKMLAFVCSMCDYKHKCWENIQTKPQLMSNSKTPKIVDYVHIQEN